MLQWWLHTTARLSFDEFTVKQVMLHLRIFLKHHFCIMTRLFEFCREIPNTDCTVSCPQGGRYCFWCVGCLFAAQSLQKCFAFFTLFISHPRRAAYKVIIVSVPCLLIASQSELCPTKQPETASQIQLWQTQMAKKRYERQYFNSSRRLKGQGRLNSWWRSSRLIYVTSLLITSSPHFSDSEHRTAGPSDYYVSSLSSHVVNCFQQILFIETGNIVSPLATISVTSKNAFGILCDILVRMNGVKLSFVKWPGAACTSSL